MNLDPLLRPRTIAVTGDGDAARAVIANLGATPFVRGPAAVDLAIITDGAVLECSKAGARAAIVMGAAEIPQGLPMRVVGPDSFGILIPHAGLHASLIATPAIKGSVAFLSQSGSLGAAVLDWSQRELVGFSAFVSVGAMADVDWSDLIDHFGTDPQTRAIVIYMESVGEARAFLSAAREVALAKPIIVIKPRGGDGDEVIDAAFRRCGVLRVNRVSEVFYMADVLSRLPRLRGPRLAILTNAGGPGLLAAGADTGVPVDLTHRATADEYARELDRLAAESDGVLAIFVPQGAATAEDVAERIAAHKGPKPVLASFMGGASVDEARAILHRANVPVFSFPDSAAHFFRLLWTHAENVRALYETPTHAGGAEEDEIARAAAWIERERAAGRLRVDAAVLFDIYSIPRPAAVESHVDAQFGPVMRFNGRYALPPLNTTLARRLLDAESAALEEMLVRFSRLIAEQRWIKSVADGSVEFHTEGPLPRLAVRPYPHRYRFMHDGCAIRAIRAEDEPLIATFHKTLSEETVYLRYFQMMQLSQRIAHERLTRICFIDYDREMALVAERDGAIHGVSRFKRLRNREHAEFAVIVSDAWQGKGLGHALLARLIEVGRGEGLTRLTGEILPENRPMQRLAERLGFALEYAVGDGVVRARLDL